MTDSCVYGGLVLTNTYRYNTYVSKVIIEYRHKSKDEDSLKDEWGETFGAYCTRSEAFPLVGVLNNIFLSKGNTTVSLYALPPFFNISLILRVVPTECEGVTNVLRTHCYRLYTLSVVTSTYIVNCDSNNDTILILLQGACIVLQHIPRVDRKDSILTIFSDFSMTTKLVLVHSNLIPYWIDRMICFDKFNIIHRTSDNRFVSFKHATGMDIGVHDDGNKPLQHVDVREIIISVRDSCLALPKVYYQLQISSSGDIYDCLVYELGKARYKSVNSVNELPIIGGCAIIILKTFRHFYQLNMMTSLTSAVYFREYYYLFIMWDPSCSTHSHVRIYFSKYIVLQNAIANYLMPSSLNKFVLTQHNPAGIIAFEILYSSKCTIHVGYNAPSTKAADMYIRDNEKVIIEVGC